MPDNQGRLTADEEKHALDWLNSKWKGKGECPICTEDDWALAYSIANMPIYYPDGIHIGGPTYAFVHVSCKRCGYTLFFNAVAMGLLPSGEVPSG